MRCDNYDLALKMYKNTLTNDFIASDKQTELKDFINSKNWYDFIIKIGFETVAKKIKIVLKEYICKTCERNTMN